MKALFKNILYLTAMTALSVLSISCEDNDLDGGAPVIRYVRVTDPASSDSLLAGAFLGDLVAIIGENLGNTKEVWFNDRKAVLTPTYVTNNSILVNVPSQAPIVITDQIKLVSKNNSEYTYDFVVRIPPPLVWSMDLEYVSPGDVAVINGFYFFDVVPVKVEFTGAGGARVQADVIKTEVNRLEVVVPDGAESGPIFVTTNFGEVESVLHYRDQRNVILNYDEPGKTPTGSWRTGIIVEDEKSLDGKYVSFQGVYNAGERTEGEGSPYESQFWAQTSGSTVENFLPGEPEDYDMKFETRIENWYGSHLNICLAPYNHSGSNQEIWSNTFNARAIWGPWEYENKAITTNGKWYTVTIPMTEFKWAMGLENGNVVYTARAFDKKVAGSLSFWVLSAPEANASPFHFFIDNVRVVPNKPL